jgi:putative aminopeptidase FrvX
MSHLYSLYDVMVSINVPSDKARAVVDVMERDMLTQLASKADFDNLRLASKSDLENLRLSVKADIDALGARVDALRQEGRLELQVIRSSMTIRLGSMLVVCLSLLFAALKLT